MNAIEAIQQAESRKNAALAKLHTELGYGSARELAEAIMLSIAAPNGRPTATGVLKLAKVVFGTKPGDSRKGRRVPDAKRNAIAAALKAGEVGSSLSAKFGVSYNIVHAIKKELGMVTPNKRTRGRN